MDDRRAILFRFMVISGELCVQIPPDGQLRGLRGMVDDGPKFHIVNGAISRTIAEGWQLLGWSRKPLAVKAGRHAPPVPLAGETRPIADSSFLLKLSRHRVPNRLGVGEHTESGDLSVP